MPEPTVKNLILAAFISVIAASCAPRTSGVATHPPNAPSVAPVVATPQSAIQDASVRAHMEFLAGDALNGRGSGTRDEWIAVSYVAAQLRRMGLEPLGENGGYIQTIEIERPELAAAPVLEMGERRLTHGKEIRVATMNAASISGQVASLKPGERAERGMVILVPELTRELSSSLANAAIVLTRPNGCGGFRGQAGALPRVSPRTVGVDSAPARPSCVSLDADSYLAAEKLTPGTRVSLHGEVKGVQKSTTWNAVGRLAGSDPQQSREVILLSAHIDHLGVVREPAPGSGTSANGDTIYNGADDDASGSVAVLELAEAIARGPRPKRTIVFAWFGSEETGGAGARYFADKPIVPLDRIIANLQFEMIGRPDGKVPPHTLWLTGFERSNLGPELAKRGAKLVQDPHPEQNFFTRSDNIQFARRGVIAHTVSSFGLHKDYHRSSDEISTIDFPHMTDAIQSMVAPIDWLANASFKPEWRPGMKP